MGAQSNSSDSSPKTGQQSPVLSVKSASGTPPGTPPPPYTLAARIASRAEKIKGSDLDLAAKIAKEEEANGGGNAEKCSQFYLKHEFKAYLQRFISPESDKYYSYYFWSRYLIIILSLISFILLLGYFSLLYGSTQADSSKNLDNGAYGIAYPLQDGEARLPSAQAHVMTSASDAVPAVSVNRPSETTTTETVATNNGQDTIEKISSTQSSESTEAPEVVDSNDVPEFGSSPLQSILPKLNSVSFIMKSIAQGVDGTREPVVKVVESHRNNVSPSDVRQLTSNFMGRMIQILQAFANRDEQPQRYTPEATEVAESEPDYEDDDDEILPSPYRHFKISGNTMMSNSEPMPFGAPSNDEGPKSVVLFVRREPQVQPMFGQPGQSAVHPLLQAIAAIARQASQQNAMEQHIPQPQVGRVMMIVRQEEPEEAESEAEPQMHIQPQPIMFQRQSPFIQRFNMEPRREYGIPMMAQPQIRQIIRVPQPTTHLPMMMQPQQMPLLALMRMHAAASQMQQMQQTAAPQQPAPQEHEYEPQQSVFQEPLPRQAMIILRKHSEMNIPQPQQEAAPQSLFEMFRSEMETSDDNEQNDQVEPEYPTMNFIPEQPKEPEVNPSLNAYRLEQWSHYNQAVKDITESPKNAEQPEESAAAQPAENEPETIPQQYSPDPEAEKQASPDVMAEEENATQSAQLQEQPVEQRQPVAGAPEPSSVDAKEEEQTQTELPAEPRISRE